MKYANEETKEERERRQAYADACDAKIVAFKKRHKCWCGARLSAQGNCSAVNTFGDHFNTREETR